MYGVYVCMTLKQQRKYFSLHFHVPSSVLLVFDSVGYHEHRLDIQQRARTHEECDKEAATYARGGKEY